MTILSTVLSHAIQFRGLVDDSGFYWIASATSNVLTMFIRKMLACASNLMMIQMNGIRLFDGKRQCLQVL
jgi:hypothetical protein